MKMVLFTWMVTNIIWFIGYTGMINEYGGIHMTCMTGYALLMLFVSIYDNSVIHWAMAHSSHIFSFIVHRFVLHYTKLRLAGWLLQVLHPPHSCINIWACINWVWNLRLVCEFDVLFWFSEKLNDSASEYDIQS